MDGSAQHLEKRKSRGYFCVSHIKDEVSFRQPGGDGKEAGGYTGLAWGEVWLEIPVCESKGTLSLKHGGISQGSSETREGAS